MDVAKLINKMNEWKSAFVQFKNQFPIGDRVLDFWKKILADVERHVPFLVKLSTNSLKVCSGFTYKTISIHDNISKSDAL